MSANSSNDYNAPEFLLNQSAEELYEVAPCGYLTTTVAGRIVKVNRTLAEWLGYEAAELIGGKRLLDLLTAGGRIFYETHFALLLRMETAVDEIALDMVCKDGRILPVLINARQKRNALGEPVLNRFTVFNASERRMYERNLLAARDLLRIMLASIADAVVATDVEGRVTFINPAACELSGWQEDAALGEAIGEVIEFVSEDSGSRIETPIAHALAKPGRVGLESTILLLKNGRRIPIDESASPIREENGNDRGAVLAFRDISARRHAEKQIEAAHEQLARRAEDLRRSNEDLTRFAQVASHDLRSPLNTILQYAQILERKYGSQLGDGRQLLSFLTSAAGRMARLIEDLLVYSQASEEEIHASTPVDANLTLGATIQNLQTAIAESGATITHDELPSVYIPSTSLLQILQNLIGNAIHYRRAEPPRIHIGVIDQQREWVFCCRDNGLGIAPEYQAAIFQPFRRLHGSDRPGSGIGLAVCQRIVERYKGRIWVESELNQGSTFFFTLPKEP